MTILDAGPVQLLHRRTPADAMEYDGTDQRRDQIARWVTGQGGSVSLGTEGVLLVYTPTKWATVPAGWWVVRGVVGQFFVIEPEVVIRCYDPAGGPDFNAQLTRNQAAAIVVEADRIAEASSDPDVAKLVTWIHQFASTTESLR